MIAVKYFPVVCKVIEGLDLQSWTLHAAPPSVFGLVSNQLAEVFKMLMKNIGVRSCSQAKMIQMIFKRVVEKQTLSNNLRIKFALLMRTELKEISKGFKKLPGLAMFVKDVMKCVTYA